MRLVTRQLGKPTFALVACSVVLISAWAGRQQHRTGNEMVRAAQAFLAELTPVQRQKAAFGFDDAERLNWHFIPRARRGLPLSEMNDAQRRAAHALLHAGLSEVGYKKAVTIMALEAVLHELEQGGRFRRDPMLYYWSIFGTPAERGRWGWRVEGHHLSLNFVVEDGRVVAATPAFFGANPARVLAETSTGIRKGTRVLADEEELARKLVQQFSEEQRARAIVSAHPPRDVRGANTPQPPRTAPIGLPASAMTERQRKTLWQLLRAYARKMPEEVARSWLAEIHHSGIDAVHFAWAGGTAVGQPHYYRIQGPDFLVEYANVQPDPLGNPANHIHSVWRSLHGDFGIRIGSEPRRQ